MSGSDGGFDLFGSIGNCLAAGTGFVVGVGDQAVGFGGSIVGTAWSAPGHAADIVGCGLNESCRNQTASGLAFSAASIAGEIHDRGQSVLADPGAAARTTVSKAAYAAADWVGKEHDALTTTGGFNGGREAGHIFGAVEIGGLTTVAGGELATAAGGLAATATRLPGAGRILDLVGSASSTLGSAVSRLPGASRLLDAASQGSTKVNEGIYVIRSTLGTYVGQSGDIDRRFAQHLITNGGRFTQTELDTAARIHVPGGKTAREIAEQLKIDSLGGKDTLLNVVNPIGPRRLYLMPSGYRRAI